MPKEATTSSSNRTTSSMGMTVIEQQQQQGKESSANRHRVEVTIEKDGEQKGQHEEVPPFTPSGPIKEAMSPSVAESIRSVFAAFIWHEGIVHDAMAAAAFLKFHPGLSKEEELMAVMAEESNNLQQPLSKKDRILQRHSVEVISTAYLKSRQVHNPSPLERSLEEEKSNMNANANRNNLALAQSERIPEEETQAIPDIPIEDTREMVTVASKLPPTMRLFVLLWEEVRSYCHHAILQQVILGSPLAAAALPSSSKSKAEKKDRKDRKKRRRTAAATTSASGGGVFGELEKRDANEPWPSIPASGADDKENKDGGGNKEAFIQICDMCGIPFQVSCSF